jgi:Bacterial TSP3 repeat
MSSISKNYEKALLVAAVVVALALAWFGWSRFGQVENEFQSAMTGSGSNAVAVKDAELIPKAQSLHVSDHGWSQSVAHKRPIDLFVGIPLFVRAGSPDPVDLIKDPPVHEPIPNEWWLVHRIDPGYSDSPAKDPDNDGFTNTEEFQAQTDPNDSSSVPPVIAKLSYLRDESLGWVLRPSFGDAGSFPFNYRDTKNQTNKTGAADMIKPGGLFFAKEPMANRFKLVGSEVRKELSKATGSEKEITWVKIEDQKENKKGTMYEFPSPLSEDRMNEHLKFDRTAVFALLALGLNSKEFRVEENTAFGLPANSPKKDYLLKSMTPNSVIVEYPAPDGSRKTVEIPRGGLPKMSQ